MNIAGNKLQDYMQVICININLKYRFIYA